MDQAFHSRRSVAVLLSQRLIGRKNWSVSQSETVTDMTTRIERRPAVARLLQGRADMLVVAGLGSPVYDVFAAGDHPLNFYDWGAMGSAAMVGLGLALAQPERPVTVFTGTADADGTGRVLDHRPASPAESLHRHPRQRAIRRDGMQQTATGFGTNLAAVARACGLEDASTCYSADVLDTLRERSMSVCGRPWSRVEDRAGRPAAHRARKRWGDDHGSLQARAAGLSSSPFLPDSLTKQGCIHARSVFSG